MEGGVIILRKTKVINKTNDVNVKVKTVSFRITEEEYQLLSELAAGQCRTVSNCIRYTFRDILEDYKLNKDKIL